MSLEVIRGAMGSGKSTLIFDAIEKRSDVSNRKNIIIVPEQFSYKTEKLLVERFGGAGLNNVEVMTFKRLYSRYITKHTEKYLTPSGKQMIIYEALTRISEESIFFGCKDKPGFVESTASLVSELTEYMITPEILREKAGVMGSKLLSEKLMAIAEILEIYTEITKDRFLDSGEDIKRLADYVISSGCFADCDFWIDEFSVFLPQHYMLFEALIEGGSDLHISVTIDSEESEFYELNRVIVDRLKRLSENLGCEYSEQKTDDECRSIASGELLFMKKWINDLNSPEFEPIEEKTEDISLFVSKDLYKEVRHTALLIRKLIMENGYRFRDIAVVCGDTEKYAHIIEAIFADYDIPYFSDIKITASEHPVALTVLSGMDVLLENWSYSSVFRFLKTGYVFEKDENGNVREIPREGIDLLENYCLKYGIRGKSVWLDDEKWEVSQRGIFEPVFDRKENSGFSDEEINAVNDTRKTVIAPFVKLYDKISGRRTVREFSEALFGFLVDINLYEGLRLRAEEFDGLGLRNEAEQIRKLWNIIIETLDQAVVVMGDEKCSREDFAGIIRSGLSAVEVSIIPSGLDRVSVSSVERSRQHDAKVMFLIGAVFGAVPKEIAVEGIFTDADRLVLKDALAEDGMDIAADTEKKCEMDRFNLFCSLFGVRDKLFISYPAANAEGETNRAATLIGDIYKLFPNLSADDDILAENDDELLYSPKSAYRFMLANHKKGGVARKVYDWFLKNEPEKLQIIKNASGYKSIDASITPENAEKLYKGIKSYSASRLNEYGKCPFGYFVKYGLGAKEQDVWQIQKFDLGSIMHLVIELYCKRVDDGAESFEELRKNWLSLTDEKSRNIINEIMDSIREKVLKGLLRDENKVGYIMMRITKIVERSVERVRKSLSAGEYAAICYEQKFRVDVKWQSDTVGINGTIDRIDMAEDAEKMLAELRVVDYKTGSKNFSTVSICNRQDMQLVLYAIAAVEMYRSGDIRYKKEDFEPRARAILYNRMRDDFVAEKDEAAALAKKAKDSLPDGLIVLDEENDEIEVNAALRMDKNLMTDRKSEVMRVDLKVDGTPTSGSQVTTTYAFDVLCDYVKKSVIEIDGEIFSGVARINPYCDGDDLACGMCAFSEVCLYNESFDKSRDLIRDKDAAMEHMKKEVGR